MIWLLGTRTQKGLISQAFISWESIWHETGMPPMQTVLVQSSPMQTVLVQSSPMYTVLVQLASNSIMSSNNYIYKQWVIWNVNGNRKLKQCRIDYKNNRIEMESSKLTLKMRPVQTKAAFTRLNIRLDRMADPSEQPQPVQYKQINSTHNLNVRKKSLVSAEDSLKYKSSLYHGEEPKNKRQQKSNHHLPDIYNPPSSIKLPVEFRTKPKRATADSVLEHRKSQVSSHEKPINFRSHHKTQIPRKNEKFRLKNILVPKELNKEEKTAVYRLIRNQFHELINATNSLSVRNLNNHFRAYIEKGNNGILVKEVLKKRWWWHIEEDKAKANLVWTEWLNKNVASGLASTPLNEALAVEEYEVKDYDVKDMKFGSVKKLVNRQTFMKLQNTLSMAKNNYFKQSKMIAGNCASRTLRQVCQQELVDHVVEDSQRAHNHIDGCLNLHSKKLLFQNFHRFMAEQLYVDFRKQWDPFKYIPLTYLIDSPSSDSIQKLLEKYEQIGRDEPDSKNIWIVKPGENSNRGNGIKVVASKERLQSQINRRLPKEGSQSKRTVIVQKYMEKCFLINNRKFDIRCYLLVTTANGSLKGYWYKEGYIRTSSSEYTLEDVEDEMVHLTNDAIQKKGAQYGKHEDSNKMSYEGFGQYLRKVGVSPLKFEEAQQEMKLIAYYLLASASAKIKRKQFTFELFGLDYMLDSDMRPQLIEANSNPCLDNGGKILSKLIHDLVDNVFMTALDPIFPPPSCRQANQKKADLVAKDYFESNKFELIFAEKPPSLAVSLKDEEITTR